MRACCKEYSSAKSICKQPAPSEFRAYSLSFTDSQIFMLVAVSLLHKGLAAQSAVEGALSCVNQQVLLQIANLRELARASSTLEQLVQLACSRVYAKEFAVPFIFANFFHRYLRFLPSPSIDDQLRRRIDTGIFKLI